MFEAHRFHLQSAIGGREGPDDRGSRTEAPVSLGKRAWVVALVCASALVTAAWASPGAYAAEWTQFHYNAAQAGYNPHETILTPATVSGLKLRMSASLGGEILAGSPLVVGGETIVANADFGPTPAHRECPRLRCVLGCFSLVVSSGRADHHPHCRVGRCRLRATGRGAFVAFDAADGQLLWSRPDLGGSAGGPVVAGGVVFTPSGPDLYALDAATGTTLWHQTPGGGVSISTAAVSGELVVVQTLDSLKAYHVQDGVLGRGNRMCYRVTNLPRLLAGALSTRATGRPSPSSTWPLGVVLWRRHLASGSIVSGTPAVAGGRVFFHVLTPSTRSLIVARECRHRPLALGTQHGGAGTVGAQESSPSVAAGVVYVGAGDGLIRGYRANNGALLWMCSLEAPSFSTPSIANGQVEIGADSGRLFAFSLPSARAWIRSKGHER